MHLVNGSQFEVGANQFVDKHGHVHLLSVIKGTFDIPDDPRQSPLPSKQQVSIFDTDVFLGEPGLSAPVIESDWSFRKQRCDVILNAQ